jgi:alkanesulfonate monooxygenase SsuD/methylene tetrahydromethanopterin reductase-like flavin-dependent oxidoreductase (luciferase family)
LFSPHRPITGLWRFTYYSVKGLKLYDIPSMPVPLYMAAEGPKSMRLAGIHGDGLITDAKSALQSEMRESFGEGARGRQESENMPIHAELFVYVGDESQAQDVTKPWRFLPKA